MTPSCSFDERIVPFCNVLWYGYFSLSSKTRLNSLVRVESKIISVRSISDVSNKWVPEKV